MKRGTNEEIRELETRIKQYIRLLIDDPSSDNPIDVGEEIPLPSHVLEEHGDDYSDYDYYDYEEYDQGLEPPPVADLIQNQENYGIYNVRRLEQSKPLILSSDKIDNLDQSAEWAIRLGKLQPKFIPQLDPISQSDVRLRFLLTCNLYDPLKKLNDLFGWKIVSYVLQRQSERFLHLLEIIVVYDGLDSDLIEVALVILGQHNLQKIFLKSIENFQKNVFRYLKPLLEVPELPSAIEYYNDGFLSAFQEAATQDIRQDRETNIRTLLIQMIEATQLLGKLGKEGKKLINYVGKDFAKEHLMEKTGLAMAIDLVNLGVPIWENILKDHIGIDFYKALFKENPRELAVRFMQMFRIPNSAIVSEILGEVRLAKLLQTNNQATLQLSTIGHLIEIRSSRCDDPEVVQKWHPGVLELLGLGARYPLVMETIDKIGQGNFSNSTASLPEPEAWIESAKNLMHILKLIQDAGFYPRPELALPILREPQRARAIIQSYQSVQDLLVDIENFEIKNLFDINESIDVTLAIAYGIVRNKIAGNLSFYEFQLITKTALAYIKQGAVVPSIPDYASTIELIVPKASFQQTKNFDTQNIEKLQMELLTLSDENALFRSWQHIFELSKVAGFRMEPETRNQLDGFIRDLDLNNFAILGFKVIFSWLLDRYNRPISEAMVRLLLGHLIQANPDIRLRLQENDIAHTVETLYEIFFERLQDLNENISLSFITVTRAWIENQATSQHKIYEEIKSVKTLDHLDQILLEKENRDLSADSDLSSLLIRLGKVFPLTTALFLKYRNLVLKENAKIKAIESKDTVKIYLKPSRSLVNLFAGVYGEDCSLSPYHAERLFHPQHVFYQLFIEGSELLQGYVSVLKVNRSGESGLKFDVINPSNNVNIDAANFLKKFIVEFSKQADIGGIEYVGIADQWNRISNRSSLIQAAQSCFSACQVEQGFELIPSARCFQSPKGGYRIVWKK